MRAADTRIANLEKQIGTAQPALRVVLYSGAGRQENDAEVRRYGINPDDPNVSVDVIRFEIVNLDGSRRPAHPKPKICSITNATDWKW